MMDKPLFLHFLSLILSIAGYALIYVYYDLSLVLFIMMVIWANNLSNRANEITKKQRI